MSYLYDFHSSELLTPTEWKLLKSIRDSGSVHSKEIKTLRKRGKYWDLVNRMLVKATSESLGKPVSFIPVDFSKDKFFIDRDAVEMSRPQHELLMRIRQPDKFKTNVNKYSNGIKVLKEYGLIFDSGGTVHAIIPNGGQ